MKDNQKNIIIVVLIIIIIGLLVWGRAYLNYKRTHITLNGPGISDEIKDNNNVDSLRWLGYVNRDMGYSISYPDTFHIAYANDITNYDEDKEKVNPNGIKIQIQSFPANDDSRGYNPSNIKTDENSTQIVSYKLGQFTHKNSVLRGPGGAFDVFYAPSSSGGMYNVLVWGMQNNKELVEKMLSTFQTPLDEIRKDEWGISFIKNLDWKITSSNQSEINLEQEKGEWIGDRMTISYITANSITDTDAKFGNVTYYWDENSQKWLSSGENDAWGIYESEEVKPTGTIPYYDVPIFYGVSRWRTYIIPLSHTQFLRLNITGGGSTKALDDLVKTIRING